MAVNADLAHEVLLREARFYADVRQDPDRAAELLRNAIALGVMNGENTRTAQRLFATIHRLNGERCAVAERQLAEVSRRPFFLSLLPRRLAAGGAR